PGLTQHFNEFHRQAWPRFVHEGNGAGPDWSKLYTDFADFQFGLRDETGALVAVGNSIPLICDGSKADVPPNIPEVLERGVVVTDAVARLQEWTGLRFPESGPYVVPGAFQPVKIDVRRDIGRYEEANVWMRHPVTSPAVRGGD